MRLSKRRWAGRGSQIKAEQASFLADRLNHRREPALTDIMSDAFDYFRAYAVRAFCKARSMPRGRMKHLQLVAGRIYNLLKKEAAYSPNTQHLEDFRAAQKLERSLDDRPIAQSRLPSSPHGAEREAG